MQRGCPGSSVPRTVPRPTRCPGVTRAVTGSYVVRSPPGWSTETTGLPATVPANTTTPVPADRTASSGTPPRSTPRWPGSQSRSGLSNARTTRGRGCSGQSNSPVGAASAGGAKSAAAVSSVDAVSARTIAPNVVMDGRSRTSGPVNGQRTRMWIDYVLSTDPAKPLHARPRCGRAVRAFGVEAVH
jgi:hypothetical protein